MLFSTVKKYTLKFRQTNQDIFEAIKNGTKKTETRAATSKFRNIKKGNVLELTCGKNKLKKKVKEVEFFKDVTALLKKYRPTEIIPGIKTTAAFKKIYFGFPKYKEKIKKFGIIAFKL